MNIALGGISAGIAHISLLTSALLAMTFLLLYPCLIYFWPFPTVVGKLATAMGILTLNIWMTLILVLC